MLKGEALRERLNEGALQPRKVTEYAQLIVSGLSAAHERAIVRRDLKPENIFVTKNDRVKILDFGWQTCASMTADQLVQKMQHAKPFTNPGDVMGTVGYMSPEQVRAKPAIIVRIFFHFGPSCTR